MVIIIVMGGGSVIGRKHSRKREAILEVLRATASHPTARWIHERLKPGIPDLSLGTVYRNLGLFREEGRVVSVGVVGGEERFDAITEPHPHWVCEVCGKVLDLPCPDAGVLAALRVLGGGHATDYRKTVFYGSCPDCGGTGEKDGAKVSSEI